MVFRNGDVRLIKRREPMMSVGQARIRTKTRTTWQTPLSSGWSRPTTRPCEPWPTTGPSVGHQRPGWQLTRGPQKPPPGGPAWAQTTRRTNTYTLSLLFPTSFPGHRDFPLPSFIFRGKKLWRGTDAGKTLRSRAPRCPPAGKKTRATRQRCSPPPPTASWRRCYRRCS
jgi:hypothetical protein